MTLPSATPNTSHALQAINLVGKLIRPAFGSERWAFANGRPKCGRVVNVRIPDLDHTYIVCDFDGETAYLSPFEVVVVTH